MSVSRKNFYKKASGRKATLKPVIRPTYKKRPEYLQDEDEEEKVVSSRTAKTTRPSSKLAFALEAEEEAVEHTDAAADAEIDEISRIIKQASQRLQELEAAKLEKAQQQSQEEPEEQEEFNGIDDEEEQFQLLQEQLENQIRQNKKLKNEIDLIRADFEKEKKSLEKTIKDLKNELHRTTPIQDNKMFSFSKDLRDALNAIKEIDDIPVPKPKSEVVIPQTPPVVQADTPVIKTPEPELKKNDSQNVPVEQAAPPQKEIVLNQEPSKPEEKKAKEKKLLITGASLLAILMIGGLVSYNLTSGAKVDQDLVNEYLDGQVQGAQTGEFDTGVNPSGVKADKNADVPFDQTTWETLNDANYGFRLEYPSNVVERLHGSTSITFMRKDSYLFKIQKHTSDLELTEFWETQKGLNASYSASADKFKSFDALKLTPIETLEYPGEKYFVKVSDRIYEVWYATPSDKFPDDDIKRVEKMLQTLTFL